MDEKSTEAEAAETRATAEGDLVATVKALAGAEASSRKWSAGTSRGYLAFFAKDLLIIASAAFFRSGVEQLVFSGTLSLAYTFLLALVLPYAERSAHNADVLTSLMLAM